ncbi:unnamed protein product [Rhizophagus irregularis]|nr:unnamed protein product [Rhizophagus irregularis]CAB5375862.1 unnamed protein product [Rhizophagus irregularis]
MRWQKFAKVLNILIICEYSKENYGLNSLINVQRNLKEVLIYNKWKFDCKELTKALEKNDTITKLLLSSVSIIIPSIIRSLINLKIGSNNVYEEDKEIIRQKIAISEFPDLQILNLKEISCFKELAMLIGKIKGNIKISIDLLIKKANNTGMLIEAIAKHYPKIDISWTKRFYSCKIIINQL